MNAVPSEQRQAKGDRERDDVPLARTRSSVFVLYWLLGRNCFHCATCKSSDFGAFSTFKGIILIPRSLNKTLVNGCLAIAYNQLFQFDRFTSSLRGRSSHVSNDSMTLLKILSVVAHQGVVCFSLVTVNAPRRRSTAQTLPCDLGVPGDIRSATEPPIKLSSSAEPRMTLQPQNTRRWIKRRMI